MDDQPQQPHQPDNPDNDEPAQADQPAPADEPADAPGSTATPRPTRWALLAVTVAVLVVGVGVAIVVAGDDGEDDDTSTGDQGAGEPSSDQGRDAAQPDASADADADAVVAVTYEAVSVDEPPDLALRFLDPGGTVVATRWWSEVQGGGSNASGDVPTGGLLQAVPAGDISLEATLQQTDGPASCTQPFTVAPGDRLILRLEDGPLADRSIRAGVEVDCARVEPVAEWVRGQTGPTGESYVGLSLADAEARAEAAGLTTRVVGVDGISLAMTLDLRPDRLNLMLFDGTVVAARLDDESSAVGPVPGG